MTTEVKKLKKDAYNTEERIIVPPIDIYETENDYVLKAEMPGISKDNLEVVLADSELEITGRVAESDLKDENLKYSEYKLYNYHRKFRVGDGIDESGITANLDNGILTLNLPKSEKVKPKKIEIKVAG